MAMALRCQGFGITESQLSLRDGACHPLENSTHYVWTVNLEECGTEMHRRHSVIRYDNSVSYALYVSASSSQTHASVAIACFVRFQLSFSWPFFWNYSVFG